MAAVGTGAEQLTRQDNSDISAVMKCQSATQLYEFRHLADFVHYSIIVHLVFLDMSLKQQSKCWFTLTNVTCETVLAVRTEKTMIIGNDNVHKNVGINNSPLRIIIIIIITHTIRIFG